MVGARRLRGLEPRILRFGVFEFDVASRELRKYGRRVRLPDQPAKVLELLLSAPQRVVTRDEMKEFLWPGGGSNDLDHGLNKAVNKVREALCDPAEHSKYIETLPKLGYRLLSCVTEVQWPAVSEKPLASSLTATVLSEAAHRRQNGWIHFLGGVLLMVVLTLWWAVLRRSGD